MKEASPRELVRGAAACCLLITRVERDDHRTRTWQNDVILTLRKPKIEAYGKIPRSFSVFATREIATT